MNRPETTKWLSKLLEEHIDPKNDPRVYWAKEVTFDYGSVSPIRVDYMQFKPVNNSVSGIEKGDVYCYEIKSSAKKIPFVRDPLAWALYHTWREFDDGKRCD